ncbi:hypothetical protein [Clostridium estertheticum]|uniref:hypothetical protein n=1 Tax=Clostridium estertheticum TaxID=238834 RepID=UPI001C0BC2DB|nr:hypothetical protein [Clostridium estertheticum]MBU3173389.1 hypothetical protein [Clostridium estertheticum]
MLSVILPICYYAIGVGVGGIIFKGMDAKNILIQFKNFKKISETEINQIKITKQTHVKEVQVLTKSNDELQKQYNRTLRENELNQKYMLYAQTQIDNLIAENKTTMKETKPLAKKSNKKPDVKNELKIIDADDIENYFTD